MKRAEMTIGLIVALAFTGFVGAGTYSGGTGQAADPYIITKTADWQELMDTPGDWDKHFVLMNDIDFEGATIAPIAPDTNLYSSGFQGTPFSGVFDGKGFALSNAVIDMTSTPGRDYVGLFGYIGNEGVILNLGAENISVAGRSRVGGLCGKNDGSILSCYATSIVSGSSYAGGLCGENDGSITSSYASGAVSGGNRAGGLCGYNSGRITSSYATGVVDGTELIGGLCGVNYGNITLCYASGMVSGNHFVGGLCGENNGGIGSSYATGSVNGTSYIGGLCGRNYRRIASCYATGAVSGTGYIGGLCGYNGGRITFCYAKGDTSGDYRVGGLCGENYGSIRYCYATGAVSGNVYFGGLCGISTDSSIGMIVGSFWDTETSGRATSSGGTGKTTAEMMNIQTFLTANWDFSAANHTPAVWFMPNNHYPALAFQMSVEVADVTGLHLSEIASSLIDVWPGHNFTLSVEASDSVAEGHVIRQAPSPGALHPGNTTVEIVIAGKPSGYHGSGTTEDPYHIETPSDWLWLIQTPSDWNKQFRLLADLDFGRAAIMPIAMDMSLYAVFEGTAFTGVLDGRGHSVRNFSIIEPANNCIGLFGRIDSEGQLHNLGAECIEVIGGYYSTGALCGINFGTITSCYATGTVNGDSNVGGLSGNNYGSIASSYASVSVSGFNSVGGFCGSNSGYIYSCYATGSTQGRNIVGGLCGTNSINHSFPYSIAFCYATGAVSGSHTVGGFCGQNLSSIISSYSTGAVSGGSSYIGGFCGANTTSGSIVTSFWDMQTSGRATSSGGIGKATAQMKDVQTFLDAGWDFQSIWTMPYGDYPLLIWQPHYTGPWKRHSNMQVARDQFAGGVIGNTIFVFGGNDPAGFKLYSGEKFDIATDTWSTIAENPHYENPWNDAWGVEELTGVALHGKFYVFGGYGGYNEHGHHGVFNYNQQYDPVTDTWTPLAPKPTTTASSVAVAYGDKIYLFGGYFWDESLSDDGVWDFYDNIRYTVIEVYDPATDTWDFSGEMPKLLSGMAIAVDGNLAYIIGGVDLDEEIQFNDEVMVYDFETGEWIRNYSSTPPEAQRVYSYASGVPVVNGKAILVGGIQADAPSNSWPVELFSFFDLTSRTWEIGPALPEARMSHLTVVSNNILYIIGGEDDITASDHVFAYSLIGSPDLDGDGFVTITDLIAFAEAWLATDCSMPEWCEGADLNRDGIVDMQDLVIIAQSWLEGQTAVPGVIGLPQSEAESAILTAGLEVGNVSHAFDQDVPQGNVISQIPSDGDVAAKGSSVDIVVSLGVDVSWVSISNSGFSGQMRRYPTTNDQFAQYLNAALAVNTIRVEGSYVKGNGSPYDGQNYYHLNGPGRTGEGAINGGKSRIRYSGGTFTVDTGFENHPVTYVSWYGAMAFAGYYGWRLPTEQEWQAVASYDGAYTYGCGNALYDHEKFLANYRSNGHNGTAPDHLPYHPWAEFGTSEVGYFGTFGYGMADMAGNVLEWTVTVSGPIRVLRGGSWGSLGDNCTVSNRGGQNPPQMSYTIGFRVCR